MLPNKRHRCCNRRTIHHVVCQHQVEVEVWPSQAEVYWQDEAYADPVNTQMRFDATVYNAPTSDVHWEVTDIEGNPGAGKIDQAGLYTAPLKGSYPHALTDVVVATAIDDPTRKAYATVSLIGFGPEVKPEPKIEVFPKRAHVYYPDGSHNRYLDKSKTRHILRAYVQNVDSDQVTWKVGSSIISGWDLPWYVYQASGSGANKVINIEARLKNDPNIKDRMKLYVMNYTWPGLLP